VDTYKHFETLCKEHRTEVCMDEIVHDHMMEWHHAMKIKVESLKEKMKDEDDHHSGKTITKK
jgi:hypothetical protein